MPSNKLTTYAELFAGAGGWSIGASELSLKSLWAIERSRPIGLVHHLNNPQSQMYIASVEALNPLTLFKEHGDVDILFASPPCQGWSHARSNDTKHKDEDVSLDILKYLSVLRPKLFFLENVTQFVKYQLFRDFLVGVRRLGYEPLVTLVEMAAFGVPQTRNRAIITCTRKDTNLRPIDPYRAADRHNGQAALVGWYPIIQGLLSGMPTDALPDSVRAILPNPNSLVASFNEMAASLCTARMRVGQKVITTHQSPDLIPAIAIQVGHTARKKLTYRGAMQPIFTVVASIGKQQTRILNPDGTVTRMSMRGNARLQTIPDWYRIPTNNVLAGVMIGNAIPPLFVRKLLELYLN